MVDKAKAQNIPVMSYDRLINSEKIDLYISHQVPVMLERPPVAARETRLFRRGNFLDKDRIFLGGSGGPCSDPTGLSWSLSGMERQEADK